MNRWVHNQIRGYGKLLRAVRRVGETATELWKLLAPYHRTYLWHYLPIVVLYEAWQIGASYSASAFMLVHERATNLWWWAGFLGVYLVYNLIAGLIDNKLDDVIVTKLINPTFCHIRSLALAKILHLDPAWYERQNSGVIVARVTQALEKIRMLIGLVCWEFTPTTMQTLLSLLLLFVFSPLAALVTMASFLLFTWVTIIAYRVTQKIRRNRHNRYEEVYREFDEYVQSHRTLVLFGQERRLAREHTELLEKAADLDNKEARIWIYRFHRIRQAILALTKVTVLGLWVLQVLRKALDLATVVFLYVILERLMISIWRFARMFEHFTEASEPIKRFCRMLNAEPTLKGGHRTELPKKIEAIEFRKVSFSYKKDKKKKDITVVRDLNLMLRPGQVVALVGTSGSGKTTTVKLLLHERAPSEGMITLNGVPITEWDLRTYRGLFATVPQGDGVHLLDDTIWGNLILAKPDASQAEVEHAASMAQLHDWIVEQDDGYNTRIGDKGIKLSGGQKQRLALARAFLRDAPVLVLDEATSAVDTTTEASIQASTRLAGKGKLVLIIAHRLSTVRLADLIVVLEKGKIIEQGTHDELIALNGKYAKLAQPQELVGVA